MSPQPTSQTAPARAVALGDAIRATLAQHADADRAPAQQAYMKSAMPFLGVTLPTTRRLVRAEIRNDRSPDVLVALVSNLWDGATVREHRYAAMTVLAARALDGDPRMLSLVEHLVRSGQWWDITDDVANRVSSCLETAPVATAAAMRAWASDPDLWVRRVAIICQLSRRSNTDTSLLRDAIETNASDADFFIRKAIGWALRQHAKTDPEWVRDFVASHELSPLSAREALKHLGD